MSDAMLESNRELVRLCIKVIEQQTEIERFREALRLIADEQQYRSGYDQTDISVEPILSIDEMQQVARTALGATR